LVLHNLAWLHTQLDALEEAESLYRKALSIKLAALASDDLSTARTLGKIAEVCVRQNKYQDAEEHYLRELAILEKLPGAGDSEVARNVTELDALYRTTGNFEGARALSERAARFK
jgi:tetratricopeptide (TPR) repeat protein